MIRFARNAFRFALAALALQAVVPATAAQDRAGDSSPSAADYCFLVADNNDVRFDADALTRVRKSDGVETEIGITGTRNIEAIAFSPIWPVLYAVDGDVFGHIHLNSGAFEAIGDVTDGLGAEGEVRVRDIDGLTFDPNDGTLFASVRRDENDVLVQIDPDSGKLIVDAFGTGLDYVPVQFESLPVDVDDIAVDPTSGVLYALLSERDVRTVLATVDRSTGLATLVASSGFDGFEGLSFDHEGRLFASEGGWSNRIVEIDLTTGEPNEFARIGVFGNVDYESITCMGHGPDGIGTDVSPGFDGPLTTSLSQNYPNPFNPRTVVGFGLSTPGRVRLSVFDMLGREVAVLLETVLPAGTHDVTFQADGLPSGLYLYRLATGEGAVTRTMTLLR